MVDEHWQILRCCGCDSITVVVKENSTDFKTPNEIYYPPRQIRKIPRWFEQTSPQCQLLIREIYMAMHSDCMTLAAMGTRTLLDIMLLEMLGDIGGFQQKLREAVNRRYFTPKQMDTINTAIEAGHAATHRGFRPTEEQLYDVLDIVEHALMGQYALAETSGRLKKSVPGRTGKRG
jgi:hypothetical protein